ncbi:hypothetical protein [Rhodobacter calidifons]|uniref:Uncharacterized protein n=1 Tax=Rhodobacter calidifons TaxID=2715277 RepID=A0ABX0G6M6_9RHOB|nr:hypothetical protein [Rhodobacter calidifons]NHB76627.1 hypothetical protein [Rhodobacter calidifons]
MPRSKVAPGRNYGSRLSAQRARVALWAMMASAPCTSASNRIVIAGQHSPHPSLAPRIVQGIRDSADQLYVLLRPANLDECSGLLLSRTADLAIARKLPEEETFPGEYWTASLSGPTG